MAAAGGLLVWNDSSPVHAQAIPEPAKPTGLSAAPDWERVTLTWADPGDGSITGYEYYQAAELAKLAASDGASNEEFGFSVSVDGDTMVVGAHLDNDNRADSGSAYVFVRPSGGEWTQAAKLTPSDGARGDEFGFSVSVEGNTVVVGAQGDRSNTGSAYVFVRPSTGWASATETAKLTASDGSARDFFGHSVSVDGDTMVVGAYGADSFTGSAYVFVKPSGGWATATETAELTASDRASNEQFAWSVSVDGDTMLVGANGDDDNGSDSGSAYVFVQPAAGWATATETAKLTASDGARNDQFGFSVSVEGDTVLVGAYLHDDSGSAYVFVRPSAGWATTTETAKLTASDGAGNDWFGISVSVEGDTVVVGAWGDDDSGARSGSAYVFVRPSTEWRTATETAKLTAWDGAAGDYFGYSVSVDGDTIVVGAYGDDSSSGSAYAFAAGGWAPIGGSGAGTIGHTVEDLAGWAEHTFSIRAVNGGGPGPASRSVTATPFANYEPEFATDTADRNVAENTSAGENIGGPVTATDPDSGDTLTYSLSGVGAASFAIDTATGQLKTLAALDYETKNSYSVIVSVHDGGDSDGNADTTVDDTIEVTINVTDEDEAGSVTLSSTQPQAGTALTATLTDPDGSIAAATSVWASSTDGSTGWTDISGATSASYTPTAGDGDRYLRVTATYTDGEGPGKSAQAISENAAQIPGFPPPSKPTGLRVAHAGERVTLSWADPGDASITRYEYYQAAEIAKLTASDGAEDDEFGFSVSVDGDTMVVGAYRDDDSGSGSGSAYVFVRPAGGEWTEASQAAKLTVSDGARGDEFGISVSVEGNTVVVGANGAAGFTGSAYVFVKPSTGWASATETAKLTASDGARSNGFGWSVSVDRDTLVVGADRDDDNGSNSGSAYVFVKPSTGWASATETAKLTASDGAAEDRFGSSVSVDGDTVVVGAYGDDDSGSDSGSAYVFLQPSAGWADATETAKLTASDGAGEDYFGRSVSVDEDTVVVGAWGDDDNGPDSGSAYVFVKPSTGWASASESAKLTASDGAGNDWFGISVSVEGDIVVVGAWGDDDSGGRSARSARSGSAYVFVEPAAGWAAATEAAKLTASDGAGSDYFGWSVSVEGDSVVVGAYRDDDSGSSSGSAYAFAVRGWVRIVGSGAGTVGHTVEELAGAAEHTFGIRAVNGGGPGPASRSVTATPFANSAPEFTTDIATRTVEENTSAGENIGKPVTATDPDSGDTLTYSLSGVDAASFDIDTATGQLKTLAALDYETKNSYSVIVSVHDGGDSDGNADTTVDDTIEVTINVTDEDEAGSVTLSSTQPQAGTALTATLTDPDGSIAAATWVWASSTDGSTGWTDISGATSASYTPTAGDGDRYLRVTATYTDGEGPGK